MALLDTHAVLWWASGRPGLSPRAKTEIARATSLLVSPVSCWEIATLVRKRRIALDRDPYDWTADLIAHEGVEEAPLRPVVAIAAGLLSDEFPGDPADRLLYATARDLGVPFITKDRRIRVFARGARDVKTVW